MPEPSALELYRAAIALPADEARSFITQSNCSEETKLDALTRLNLSISAYSQQETPNWQVGDEIQHYVITGELGRGGMGVVYSAQDTQLRREVALKFLCNGPMEERAVQLLEREARTASSLNHPNIVTVHEVIRSGPSVAIVMEKIDGCSLRQLMGSPLPLAQVRDIGEQVASAIAAAHSQGIVHRDLKPENIMVRADGYVKVLDFGLACNAVDGAITNLSTSGALAGTWRYMSPEQAKAAVLTPASDVYSLGLILYELGTGKHPFLSESPLSTAHAITTGDANPMAARNEDVPHWLSALVSGALQRDPASRPSARAVAESLAIAAVPESKAKEKSRWRGRLVALAAATIASLFYIGFVRTPLTQVSVVDTRIDLGTSAELEEEGFALSPNGRTLLFVAGGRLNYVSLAGGAAKPWREAEGGRFPFWSPDGKEAGFYWKKKLWRSSFPNGPLREICDATEPLSASWGSRGVIVFSAGDGPILQVPASGGTPIPVTKVGANRDYVDASPTFLPDSSRFLFYRTGETRIGSLMLGTMDGTMAAIRLASATTSAVYVPRPHSSTGALIYSQERKLLMHPFNPSTVSFTGRPSVLTEQVRQFRMRVIPASVASNGEVVYAEEEDKADQPKIFDRRGQLLERLGQRREYIRATPSPDFRRIAMVSRDPGGMLYSSDIFDRRTGSNQRLETTPQPRRLVWSRDGNRIVYLANAGASNLILAIQNFSSNEVSFKTIPLPPDSWVQDWSPDGKALLITAQVSSSDRNIWAAPLDPSRLPALLVRGPGKNDEERWSPDGRFMAYQSNESGRTEVYVIPSPPDGRRWQVSAAGGQEPRWRTDGKELFYLTLDHALMSVRTSIGTRDPAFSPPALLFGGRSGEPAILVWHAEPSPDGKQFVILTRGRPRGSSLRLRTSWWAEEMDTAADEHR